MTISRRVSTLAPSATVAVMNRAKEMQAAGLDVLSFAAGEPDFDTPQVIKQAAIDALLAGQTKYMPTAGDKQTRTAIADKLTRENKIVGVTPDHIVIGAGGKHSLFCLFHTLFDNACPGEEQLEAILPVPAWVSYKPQIELAGGRVVEVDTTPETGFKMSPAQLKGAITERTRVIVINSPSNPTGVMYTPDELRAIALVIEEAINTIAPDLVVITDEIYEKITFGRVPHFSLGSLPAIAEHVVTINGMSKAYAMTGWRIGYMAGSGGLGLKIAKAVTTLQGQMSTNITSFTYPAIRAAIAEAGDEVEKMRLAFKRRGELITGLLRTLPGMNFPAPDGAFYVFPDVSAHFGKRSRSGRAINCANDFCESLLEDVRVAFVPGEDFGGCGDQCVRLSFACSDAQIEQGVERLGEFLANLRN
jgi:aspartate aminotransferase